MGRGLDPGRPQPDAAMGRIELRPADGRGYGGCSSGTTADLNACRLVDGLAGTSSVARAVAAAIPVKFSALSRAILSLRKTGQVLKIDPAADCVFDKECLAQVGMEFLDHQFLPIGQGFLQRRGPGRCDSFKRRPHRRQIPIAGYIQKTVVHVHSVPLRPQHQRERRCFDGAARRHDEPVARTNLADTFSADISPLTLARRASQ